MIPSGGKVAPEQLPPVSHTDHLAGQPEELDLVQAIRRSKEGDILDVELSSGCGNIKTSIVWRMEPGEVYGTRTGAQLCGARSGEVSREVWRTVSRELRRNRSRDIWRTRNGDYSLSIYKTPDLTKTMSSQTTERCVRSWTVLPATPGG